MKRPESRVARSVLSPSPSFDWPHKPPPRRDTCLEPPVPFFLELERELLAARLHDASLAEHVDEIRHDIRQHPLIMGHQEEAARRIAHGIHAVRDRLERVDVETRVSFVEDTQPRLEHGHLKDL